MSTILGPALAQVRSFSARDWSAAALNAAEMEEWTHHVAQKALDRTNHTQIVIEHLNGCDRFLNTQQLHDMVFAMAQLAERLHGAVASEAMANVCDSLNDAIGWIESMLPADPVDVAQDAAESFGGTD